MSNYKSSYNQLKDLSSCVNKNCGCNLSKLSSFDQLQYQAMVEGQSNYTFSPSDSRKLEFNYAIPNSNLVEHFSGMHTPYNYTSYLLWPALSKKC